jgi:hypothetical protein
MFEQHWHRTPPLFVVIVHRHLIHSHIHDEQSQQTMAASYANVVQTYLSRNSKPPDVQDTNEDEIDNPNTVVRPDVINVNLSISLSM